MSRRSTHRRPGPALMTAVPPTFEPRHCKGHACAHNHAGASVPLARLGTLQQRGAT